MVVVDSRQPFGRLVNQTAYSTPVSSPNVNQLNCNSWTKQLPDLDEDKAKKRKNEGTEGTQYRQEKEKWKKKVVMKKWKGWGKKKERKKENRSIFWKNLTAVKILQQEGQGQRVPPVIHTQTQQEITRSHKKQVA